MTEQIPYQPTVKFLHLLCRLGTVEMDAADADTQPDLMSAGGTVKITLDTSNNQIRLLKADGRARMASMPDHTYTVQAATGELVNTSDGSVGVWVIDPSSEGVDPQNFTYTATVTPAKVGNVTPRPWQVTFNGDSALGGVVDLAAAASVARTGGTPALDGRVSSLEGRVDTLETTGGGGGATTLDGLTDVVVTGAVAGQVLGFDGTGWGPTTAGAGSVADATTTTKGILQLAGDLAGTATAPTVPALADKVDSDDSRLSDARTPTAHEHPIADVTGLQAELDGKQAAGSYAPALGPDDNYVTDAEKTALHGHSNKAALDQVSGTNTGDQTLAGLGAAPASGQSAVNTLTPAGTVTIPATHAMHTLTMTGDTTLAFANPTAGHVFALKLSGDYVPTFPASVAWAGGAAPTYASGSVYTFATFNAGMAWTGAKL